MSIEAMKQALGALETKGEHHERVYAAITALRQAIEQAEKPVEPPAYVEPVTTDYHEGWEEGFKAGNALAPPKREWVGLTDEEIAQVVGSPIDEVYLADFHRVIEKLRSKNT
jgi:DNA-directed RNA polymerase specialized sigma24 family protein